MRGGGFTGTAGPHAAPLSSSRDGQHALFRRRPERTEPSRRSRPQVLGWGTYGIVAQNDVNQPPPRSLRSRISRPCAWHPRDLRDHSGCVPLGDPDREHLGVSNPNPIAQLGEDSASPGIPGLAHGGELPRVLGLRELQRSSGSGRVDIAPLSGARQGVGAVRRGISDSPRKRTRARSAHVESAPRTALPRRATVSSTEVYLQGILRFRVRSNTKRQKNSSDSVVAEPSWRKFSGQRSRVSSRGLRYARWTGKLRLRGL